MLFENMFCPIIHHLGIYFGLGGITTAPSLEGKHPSKTSFFSQKEWRVGGVVRMNALGSFKGAFFLVHHHDYKYPWPGPGNRAVSAAHRLHCSQKQEENPSIEPAAETTDLLSNF